MLTSSQVLKQQQWGMNKDISPERTKVWVEPKITNNERKKIAVVYYLSRNGKLEQPHFMELSVFATRGLYLRDVIDRLNVLRGRTVARMYSWSSKRSYKNGFVWHDLCEDDFIYPVRGNEYVLKGTELLNFSSLSTSLQSSTSSSSTASLKNNPLNIQRSARDDTAIALAKRNKITGRSSSFDINEYKASKNKAKNSEFSLYSADASTQTHDHKIHRRQVDLRNDMDRSGSLKTIKTTSVKRGVEVQTSGICSSARMRASAMLMHLLSCASICETKEQRMPSVPSYFKDKQRVQSAVVNVQKEIFDEVKSFRGIKMEDREYFSGSLVDNRSRDIIETELRSLKRSSSFTACRNSKVDQDKELGLRFRCIPKKSNKMSDGNHFVSLSCIKHETA